MDPEISKEVSNSNSYKRIKDIKKCQQKSNELKSLSKDNEVRKFPELGYTIFREFDPGSGRTLAACLTHASRTENYN